MSETSTKPYILRALHEWCADNGYTPHIVVRVDPYCRVPTAHVKDGHITLNIGMFATHGLKMDNEFIEFQARFNGVAQNVSVPVTAVTAIYARETGAGMGFEVEEHPPSVSSGADTRAQSAPDPSTPPDDPPPSRPHLRLVK